MGRTDFTTLRVIAHLLKTDSEVYGLKIAEDTGIQHGTLYPILSRLTKAGYLHRRCENSHPKARRYYSVVDSRRPHLHSILQDAREKIAV